MAHDVFISYSSADKVTADAVCARLEGKGIRCWIAPRDVLPGAEWAGAIIDAINESQVMVLVYSANANDSAQIKREIERAVHKGIAVVPLRIENVPMSKTLEYFISTPHWLDALTPPLDRHLDYLAQTIETLLRNAAERDGVASTEPGVALPPPVRPPLPPPVIEAPRAEPLIDVRSKIESFIDPSAPKGQTLAEALFPHSGMPATVGLVAAGVVLMAVGALLRLPGWPFSPLHLLAVLFVGAALGSRLGLIAVIVYEVLGILLPILPGAQGLFTLRGSSEPYAQYALGYLLGLVAAAFVVGWLAERRSWDRTYKTAGPLGAIGILVAGIPGFIWVWAYVFFQRSSSQLADYNVPPPLLTILLTLVIFTFGLPLAWKWVETQRAKRGAVSANS